MPHWNQDLRLFSLSPFYHWLNDQDSLTKKIKQHCTNTFKVKLLSQTEQKAYPDEYECLELAEVMPVVIREVVLYCGDIPWVFARTIIPTSSLTGEAQQLSDLQTKPLGEVLFASTETQRKIIEATKLQAKDQLFQQAIQHLNIQPAHLWARRTLFLFHQQPLLVNEIFLPECGKNNHILS